jgi:hypothetical protein
VTRGHDHAVVAFDAPLGQTLTALLAGLGDDGTSMAR